MNENIKQEYNKYIKLLKKYTDFYKKYSCIIYKENELFSIAPQNSTLWNELGLYLEQLFLVIDTFVDKEPKVEEFFEILLLRMNDNLKNFHVDNIKGDVSLITSFLEELSSLIEEKFFDKDILASFLRESITSFSTIESSILEHINAIYFIDLIETMRAFHTLKGNISFFPYSDLQKLTQQIENSLKRISQNPVLKTKSFFHLLLFFISEYLHIFSELEKNIYYIPKIENLDTWIRVLDIKEEKDLEQIQKFLLSNQSMSIDEKNTVPLPIAWTEKLTDLLYTLSIDLNSLQEKLEVYLPKLLDMELSDTYYRVSKEFKVLQNMVQDTRMVSLNEGLFLPLEKNIYNLARNLGKKVDVTIEGRYLKIDRDLLKKINANFIHLVKNSLDHGIETPSQRIQNGKLEKGNITIIAKLIQNKLTISFSDDGKGLNKEKIKAEILNQKLLSSKELEKLSDQEIFSFIFHPNFSTRKKVSYISGQGVGLNSLKKMIDDLKGTIDIETIPGKKTSFIFQIPISNILSDLLVIKLDKEKIFAIPSEYIHDISYDFKFFKKDNKTYIKYSNKNISFAILKDLLENSQNKEDKKNPILILNYDNKTIAMQVQEICYMSQFMTKKLPENLQIGNSFISYVLTANRKTILVLNIPYLFDIQEGKNEL